MVYFDLARDLKLRTEIKKERNELINLMLDHKNNGGKTQAPKKEEKPHNVQEEKPHNAQEENKNPLEIIKKLQNKI